MKIERLLICGDRNWNDADLIGEKIDEIKPKVVIHGDARGADKLAGECAERRGIEVEKYPADWNKYGKRAGPIRNQQMIDEGKPDAVLAFHDDLDNSKGTRDMVRRAGKAGIPWCVVSHQRPEGLWL